MNRRIARFRELHIEPFTAAALAIPHKNFRFEHIRFPLWLISHNTSVIKSYQSGNADNYWTVDQIASKYLWPTGS
jgi:hypothetical protein